MLEAVILAWSGMLAAALLQALVDMPRPVPVCAGRRHGHGRR